MSSAPMHPFSQPSTLPYGLPDFAAIGTDDYEPAIEQGIDEEKAIIARVAADTSPVSFENVLEPLERGSDVLRRVLPTFFNLVSSDGTDELHAIEARVVPELTALSDSTYMNAELFARIDALREAAHAGDVELTAEQRRILDLTHRRFVLRGAQLSEGDRERLAGLNQEIAAKETEFSQAVTKDMKAAAVHITDPEELAGLDEGQRSAAREAAQEAGLDGWLLTLILPTVQPQLSSLERRDVRERLYRASADRGTATWELAARIAHLRAQKAALLGFEDFASLAVADRTAQLPMAVDDLFSRTIAPAMRNVDKEAERIARRARQDGIEQIEAWDWPFYTDRIWAEDYAVDPAQVRPYLTLDKVLEDGVFRAAHDVYGLSFVERDDLTGYHPEVRIWEVFDEDGTGVGLFLGDFFTRGTKRGGAWMNTLVDQSRMLDERPVVVNNLNITKPAPGEPAYVSLDEVRTLFHEFGHALHALLSDVEHPSVSGTSVARDVVEFPSQVNEQWIMHPDFIEHYARHVETGEPMPQELRDRIAESELWGEGQRTAEYLGAAVLDWQWHRMGADITIDDPHAFEERVLEDSGLKSRLVAPRYRTGYFNHTFSGGYASGYYSYMWAEVFDADSVEWFREQEGAGVPHRENGRRFAEALLSRGGSADMLELFDDFRGRDRDVDFLLRRRGLLEES